VLFVAEAFEAIVVTNVVISVRQAELVTSVMQLALFLASSAMARAAPARFAV
jgi:hypothetical protein